MPSSDIFFVLENDINPFIIFDCKGKITFLNKNASMLSSINISKELYALALEYAPKNFGFKVSYMDLYYADKSFYAIMVAYQNEDSICLHLYKNHIEHQFNMDNKTQIDINLLLESSIEYFIINKRPKIKLFMDDDIHLVKINQNYFLILMRKLLNSYSIGSYIDITLKIKLGEIVEMNNIKYYIIQIIIQSDKKNNQDDEEIKKIAEVNNILVFFDKIKSILEIISPTKAKI
jgi:hypothetical protein